MKKSLFLGDRLDSESCNVVASSTKQTVETERLASDNETTLLAYFVVLLNIDTTETWNNKVGSIDCVSNVSRRSFCSCKVIGDEDGRAIHRTDRTNQLGSYVGTDVSDVCEASISNQIVVTLLRDDEGCLLYTSPSPRDS